MKTRKNAKKQPVIACSINRRGAHLELACVVAPQERKRMKPESLSRVFHALMDTAEQNEERTD